MSGNIDDVLAPRSMKNIVLEVMDYIETHKLQSDGKPPTDFETYDEALQVIWPELYKTCSEAALLTSISIYVEIAERWGFHINTPEIKDLKL